MKGRGALPPLGRLNMDGYLSLKLRFTLVARVSLRARGVLSTPCRDFMQSPLQSASGRGPFRAERCRTASKRIAVAAAETFSDSILPRCGQSDQPIAGRRRRGAQALALPAQHQHRAATQVDIPRRRFPSASAP